ncbi:hypothetical protein N7516_008924 [Penicillium verrucosum]|uniref:uncharacterized protein n=1 Tax=Penicillium verrucosum TaxID=60171 RepID=UPI0025452E3F|nr:uncharacterized protein N7516_008924 [Penicillium verrucosum]KAJ5927151.1 hypothetical protein N7516_008924 [Penicillium verrucosum]
MSTPEAFSEFNTAPSNVDEEPIYGPPTLTQEEIISLLAQTQDEGPEDYTSNFNGQPGNYQFGLGDNIRLETAVQSLSIKVERLVGRIDEYEERVGRATNAVMRLEDIFQCVIRREQAAMSKFGDLASRYGTLNE